MKLLDGKQLAQTMQAEIAAAVEAFVAGGGPRPGLATVIVGDNPASRVYVRNKRRSCEKVGMTSHHHDLPVDTVPADLLALVGRLSADPAVHGILVQLPLPDGINEEKILSLIRLEKDVDGFHPVNIGRLAGMTAKTISRRIVLITPSARVRSMTRHRRSGSGRCGE